MSSRRALMAGGNGMTNKIRYAEGNITLSNPGALTILHNLGTSNVAVYVWPVGTVRPTAGYQAWHMSFVNLPDAIPAETILDFSGYNSEKFPEPITINGKTSGQISISGGNSSPWTTQVNWYQGNFNSLRSDYTISENQIQHNQNWAPGTYHWIVVGLSVAT